MWLLGHVVRGFATPIELGSLCGELVRWASVFTAGGRGSGRPRASSRRCGRKLWERGSEPGRDDGASRAPVLTACRLLAVGTRGAWPCASVVRAGAAAWPVGPGGAEAPGLPGLWSQCPEHGELLKF